MERMCVTEREARGPHAPSSRVVVFLNLTILKGAEQEQFQQLDSTVSAPSEATAEVAGCVSL